MRKLFIFLVSAMGLMAQAPTLTVSTPGSVRAGQSVIATVGLTGTSNPAGVQFTLTAPGLGTPSAAPGAAAVTAQKSTFCNTTTSATICLVVGINSSTMAAGEAAKLTYTVPITTLPGTVSLALSGTLGVDLSGSGIVIAAGPAATLTILPRLGDLNSDGKVDIVDLQLLIDQVEGRTPCGTADLNGDSKCDVLDAQLLIRAALGL